MSLWEEANEIIYQSLQEFLAEVDEDRLSEAAAVVTNDLQKAGLLNRRVE